MNALNTLLDVEKSRLWLLQQICEHGGIFCQDKSAAFWYTRRHSILDELIDELKKRRVVGMLDLYGKKFVTELTKYNERTILYYGSDSPVYH